jgi:hypothetical protein
MKTIARTSNLHLGSISVVTTPEVRKSKTVIFWEKNPGGIIKVNDRRAVNK